MSKNKEKPTKEKENTDQKTLRAEAKEAKKEQKAAKKSVKKAGKALKAKESETSESVRYKYLRWYKLDNSAQLFPVIAGENTSNTYRISAVLNEEIDRKCLQEALDTLLPKFDPFNVRLRRGFFWYYFEENGRRAPIVKEEASFPCTFIHSKLNKDYLFRVTYYKRRINIEVFHALADGMGGINFLKELVYHYLRLKHPELSEITGDGLTSGTSMNLEDSFLRNYRKPHKPLYATQKAYRIKGEKLRDRRLGVMNVQMDLNELKAAAHRHSLSINEYLVGTYLYAIYRACLNSMMSKRPIRVSVPVNLRSYFESVTSRNFFVMIAAELFTEKENYTYEEVLEIVKDSLRSQMDKQHLEEIFSYNVSNQANLFLRLFPLFIKHMAIKFVYLRSAGGSTSTMTNIGNVKVEEPYKPYIENFHAVLSTSVGQFIKATICSYDSIMNVTFGSQYRDVKIQQCFVKQLVEDDINITLETNGVFYG